MNRSTRRRLSPQPHTRWTLRFAVGLLAVTVALAYGGGISLAHWASAIDAAATIGTGSLTVDVADDGSEIDFKCDTHTFPHHALSFVRFWAPDQTPGDLLPRGSGAVKIEEDGNEIGDDYWIDPADAAIGEPSMVYLDLGTSIVTITGWIPKPGEPGEYIGFAYTVEGDPVTVDAKAATDLWRQVITGAGVWSLDGIDYDGPTITIESCEPAASEIVLTITNVGSIPALPYLTLAGDPGSEDCGAFEATVVGADDAVLVSGSLCSLYGQRLLVAAQIDPSDTTTVTITLEPAFPVSPGDYAEAFSADVVFTQWNSPLETGYGWIDTASVPLTVTLTVTVPTPTPATAVASEPTPEPPAADATMPEPIPEPGLEPEADELVTASLSGLVWLDDNEDTATIPGTEPVLDGIGILLFDESGAEHSLTLTDADGSYVFEGLDPGRYTVGVRAPDGYSFIGVIADAADGIPLDTGLGETLASRWSVNPIDVVVADIIRATTAPLGVVGWTGIFELVAGENIGLADAALAPTPVETPPEPDPPTTPEPEEPGETVSDNTDISAKEPEPDPFDETLPTEMTGGDEPEEDPPTEP